MISIVGCKLLKKIGEGELGVVYKAHLLSDDRYVAVKVLKGINSEFSPAVTRFNLQAAAATDLRHPNIVEGYKTGKTEQTSYFIMDLGRGYSLADWMQRKGRIPESDALLTIRSVAEGLRYAWDMAGYIHADIKPSNILIDADGVVKISDFSGLRYDVSDPFWTRCRMPEKMQLHD